MLISRALWRLPQRWLQNQFRERNAKRNKISSTCLGSLARRDNKQGALELNEGQGRRQGKSCKPHLSSFAVAEERARVSS